MTARDHNNLLGIFFLIQGGIVFLCGLLMTLIYAGMGAAMFGTASRSDDRMVGGIFFVVGLVVGVFMLLFSVFYFFTGLKVRKVQNIGRTLGIVVSILSLFSFPLGTALGIYGLWFFLGDMGKALYSGQMNHPGFQNNAPPPPNNWR